MEYYEDEFNSNEVDDNTLNTCDIKICPIPLLDLILAKVRENTISFSACRRKKQVSIVSELMYEIEDLERTVNNSEVPVPEIIDRIQEMKERLDRQIEKKDFERAYKNFAKMNLEDEKPTRYFCSLEKQMKKSTLLDSLFTENKELKLAELFNQKDIEKEVRRFYKN